MLKIDNPGTINDFPKNIYIYILPKTIPKAHKLLMDQ